MLYGNYMIIIYDTDECIHALHSFFNLLQVPVSFNVTTKFRAWLSR